MTYAEALAWLYGTQRFGIKLGLENVRRLLRELDVPGDAQRIIHVAGTNGKGSVCAMVDSGSGGSCSGSYENARPEFGITPPCLGTTVLQMLFYANFSSMQNGNPVATAPSGSI